MSNTWQASYDEIKSYIAQHPSIAIKPEVFSIPGDVRPGFYLIFDIIRENFINDNFPVALEKARTLSKNHEIIRKELITSLALEEIDVRATIKEFLVNPIAQLSKLLYDPLFDLLMGKIDKASFEQTSDARLQTAFDNFFRVAEQSWLMLALLQVFAPDEVYIVPPALNDFANECDSAITDSGGLPKQMVPDAVQASRLSFDSSTFVSYLVPKVIMHSKPLNLYVSLVSEFRTVPLRVVYLNSNVEWFSVSGLHQKIGPGRTWPELAIYLAKKPNDLTMVSDNQHFAHPDIIMHVESPQVLRDPGEPDLLRNRNRAFEPRLGSYVICTELIPQGDIESLKQQFKPAVPQKSDTEANANPAITNQAQNTPVEPTTNVNPPEKIEVMDVGYNAAKLEPVVDAILKSRRYAELAPNPQTGTTNVPV